MLVNVANSLQTCQLCVLLLNGGGWAAVIPTAHSKQQFPSKVSQAYITFVTKVLILPIILFSLNTIFIYRYYILKGYSMIQSFGHHQVLYM
jgi:hypothetical protein